MPVSPFRTSTSSLGLRLTTVLALPFALIGSLLAFVTVRNVIHAKVMQAWPTVPATLQHVELQGPGSRSEKLVATYSYVFDEQEFIGHTVSIYNVSNVGSFNKRAYDELNGYLSRQAPYSVHVNPKVPTESILMPALRWEVISFYLIFVAVFGGAGWGLLIGAFFGFARIRTEAELAARYPNEPWRQRIEWSTGRIKSDQDSTAVGAVFLAVMWNLFSWPMAFSVPDRIHAGEYSSMLLLFFPVLGIGLVGWVVISILRARRFGETYLELETFPGRQGEHFRGRVSAPAALGESTEVQLTMSCERHSRASGSRGTSEIRTKTLWKREVTASTVRGQSPSGEVGFEVDFALPSTFPDSSRDLGEWHTWQLVASAVVTGADFEAEFEVPVFKRG